MRRPVSLAGIVLACVLAIPASAATPPSLGALVPLIPATETATLLALACQPENCPTRQEARSRLHRELVPHIDARGIPASAQDEVALLRGLSDYPCAAGELRVERALVLGDAARVSLAGSRGGGCSVLMRRDGDGWALVMVLGWTLRS